MVYGVSVPSGLYGCYGSERVGFVCCVGVRCLAVGFGAFGGDTSTLYTCIHIYIYRY